MFDPSVGAVNVPLFHHSNKDVVAVEKHWKRVVVVVVVDDNDGNHVCLRFDRYT